MIGTLKDKLLVSEKKLTHSSSVVSNLMTSPQKLNKIIINNMSFGDKRGIGFDGVSTAIGFVPIFIKPITQETKLKFVAAISKGKLVAML